MAGRAEEYEPILAKSFAGTASSTATSARRGAVPSYGGFSQQKRKWAASARRSRRLRCIASAQLVLGALALFNYLWITNSLMVVAGAVGLMAVRADKTSWAVIYLAVCAMEFARIVLLLPRVYERFIVPDYAFTGYEYFQVGVLVVEEAALIPAAFAVVVVAATTSLSRACPW